MSALQNITDAIARDRQSKPWENFVKQNPGMAPLVTAYLDGTGPRPSDAQLTSNGKQNHYAFARRASEDARLALEGDPPEVPELLKDFDIVISVPGPLTKISGTTFRADAFITL